MDGSLFGRDTDYEPAPGYQAARAADAEIEGLLDGLSYAANKSLHLLVGLVIGPPPVDLVGVSYLGVPPPPPPRRGDVPRYRWPDLNKLRESGRRDRELHASYNEHLWDQTVDVTLTRAVEWLRAQRP